MTRFDADPLGPVRTTAPVSARRLVAAQPAVFLITIALATALICVAFAALLAGQAVRSRLAGAVEAVQLSVFLQPQLSRPDAEALRARITATPRVASARLRLREDALSAVIGSGSSAPALRGNPLPDVWMVTLRSRTEQDGDASLSARIADVRSALSGLGGVDSIRVDGPWVDALDRWTAFAARALPIVTGGVTGGLVCTLFAVFFLAGRALAGEPSPGRLQALATIGLVCVLVALTISFAAIYLPGMMSPGIDATWRPIVESIDRNGQVAVIALVVAMMIVGTGATAWGGARQ